MTIFPFRGTKLARKKARVKRQEATFPNILSTGFSTAADTPRTAIFPDGHAPQDWLCGLLRPVLVVGEDEMLALLLALLPALAGILLHVGDRVVLVDNFHAEDRLDDVFQREDALEAAVLVDDQGDLVLGLQKGFPDVADRGLLVEHGDVPLDVPQTHVELVVGEVLQDVVAHDIAGDELRRLGIDRDAGIVRQVGVFVELPERHGLRSDVGDHPRGHHVVGLDVIELDDVLDDLVLGLVEDALFLADVRHGGDFLAADGDVGVFRGEDAAEVLDEDHQRIHGIDEEVHDAGEPQEVSPAGRADGLRDDFGEQQDEDRGDRRNEAEPLAAEEQGGLAADARRADGVGDGVEGQDGGDGPVDVILEPGEQFGVAVALLLAHGDIRYRRGHQYRFQQRAQEGDSHGHEQK